MSLKYNFAFKSSDLKKWEPKNRKNEIKIISNRQKLTYLIEFFKKNPIIIYPHLALFAISFFIQLANLYPSFIIRRLEPNHQEYLFISQRIKKITNNLNKFKRQLKDIKPNFVSITPTYLFTFYIQNSIPVDIQLEKYKLNSDFFFIKANSYSLKAINEMISLLIESPIIDQRSVKVKKIKREQNNNGLINVEITGKVLKTNIASKEYLYKESSAFGLLEKLTRFKETESMLGK